MAIRYGDRTQARLFPASIEDYVAEDAPVRAYDTFVDELDLDELGINSDPRQVGNPRYEPRGMLKLLLYGCSYGVRSSRKLERETHYNLSFIWLMGGMRPDHKTVSEFRRNNKPALKKALKQCAQLCLKLDLVDGNTLFIDGSKMRANASIKNSWDRQRCEKALARLDERIEEILAECEAADEQENGQGSFVAMKGDLKSKELRRQKVREILRGLDGENNGGDEKAVDDGKRSTNTVDSDCTRINGRQGAHAGYNAQIAVDGKNGLIVGSDVVNENTDMGQLSAQIEQANENLGKKCEVACADSGYAETEDLKKAEKEGARVIVPSQRQTAATRREAGEFDNSAFRYDKENDRYICVEGKELLYRSTNTTKRCRNYRISEASICVECRHFGRCTKDKYGRTIARLENEEDRERFEAEYAKPESQEIYKHRKEKAEHPFGHMKRNLGVGAFLLRGLEGVRAEMSIISSCFNVARMITLLGVKGLIEKLRRTAILNPCRFSSPCLPAGRRAALMGA